MLNEGEEQTAGEIEGCLALSAAILFCGLTYTRVAHMANLLNMPILSDRSFYRFQKEFLHPVLHTSYIQQKQTVLEFLKGSPLHLSGDGCCDSPGYSAKYCPTPL